MIKKLFIIMLVTTALWGCSQKEEFHLTIEGDYNEVTVFMHGEQVHHSTDKDDISEMIKNIENNKTMKTEGKLREPEGKVIFSGEEETMEMGLYRNGDLLYDGYLIAVSWIYG
ncbi:hypothetical protein GJU40_14660 [Bacillus lacus]|uniref:DUF3221 domain-containing protein n=1 Tax=Metabacillus lacus TaxID=1983721 RepID=A0A7X2LZV3_9BACI|nr:hypothetical protein [Metabacillus lacus]MRX73388.1 hypothetical protein [Metabacillus lacus]